MLSRRDAPVAAKVKSARRHLGTAQAVAEFLNVPKSTVYDWAREEAIPGVVRIGRRVRFDLDVIEAWVADGGDRGDGKREASYE